MTQAQQSQAKSFSSDEVVERTAEYFGGDKMAGAVFLKYALPADDGGFLELSPPDMHARLARELARIENRYSNPMSEEEILGLLSRPSHRKLGMGPIIPQGSPMAGIGNTKQFQSISNCFVIDSPYDSFGGIFHTDEEEAEIMKRRGGVGFDVSTLRPKDVKTSNAAGTTDGIGVFLERYSATCRGTAQNGRRGALMLTISIRHPEIETFINIKRDLKKVTGANISIRVTDDFMVAVENDEYFTLQWPVDVPLSEAKITREVRARDIWDQIIDAAWNSAEPGVLFWDTVKRNSPADAYASVGFSSVSTNPCVVGDTLIAVADGRNAVSIRQLAEEGRDVPVYSTDIATGKVEIKWGRSPRLTKVQAEVWKLTLDDGTCVIATPDHKILLRNLTYVNLQDLKSGDSIFPFSTFDSNGYRQVCNTGVPMTGGARRNRRQYRLIHEFFNGSTDSKLFAIHHCDFDSRNDRIENLKVMTHDEHRELHSRLMIGDNNPYHRMSSEWKLKFAKHSGESNGRFSGHTNEQLLEAGRRVFEENGKITRALWKEYAKKHAFPQFLANQFRFGSWQNFANQVSSNHKVVSVEKIGTEDVYNITVDDNHNYHVITSLDENGVVSSGICVKNCGEIPLSSGDSCRLLVIDLTHFVVSPFTPEAHFDFTEFERVVGKAQRLMDDIVDLEVEAVDRIIEKIESDPEPEYIKARELSLWRRIRDTGLRGRRTGFGVTALGDALALLDLKYGQFDAISMTDRIYRSLALGAYRSSVDLAEERGAFPAYDPKLEAGHPFLSRIRAEDPALAEKMDRVGRRNIALTTTAPVGSTSMLTQTTSGIEPLFKPFYVRKKKVSGATEPNAELIVDEMGDRWQKFNVYHHYLKEWMDITGNSNIDESPYAGASANEIDWLGSVAMQAAAQKWVCHSISKTCNLPKDVSHDVVSDVYMNAWKTGCKGFTIYRDESRDGVLVSEDAVMFDVKKRTDGVPTRELERQVEIGERFAKYMPSGYVSFLQQVRDAIAARKNPSLGAVVDRVVETKLHSEKRPKELPCEIHRVNVRAKDDSGDITTQTYIVLLGLLNGKPYEIFCGLSEHVDVPKKCKNGVLVKNGKKAGVATYNLRIPIGDDDDAIVLKDVVNLFENATYGAFTRILSLALRHEIPLQFVVEQLQKDKYSDMQSFSRVIARVLKHHILDGTPVSGEKKCDSCGAEGTLVYEEKCTKCTACGNGKCG